MQLKTLAISAFAGLAAAQTCKPRPGGTFAENVIYQPVGSNSVSYPRVAELSDGTILATIVLSGTGVFPVFSSKDQGATWKWISNITDQVNGLGMSAQPAIYELPFQAGSWPAGTILASGNSWGRNSTNIDLYASPDKGATWKFVSKVATGSGPGTQNGNPCIWEPFILADNGTVGVFYSDQRDPLHGQKLAHQESTDLVNWGPVVNDVAYKTRTDRPGMTVINYIPPLKKWMLVYEYPGTPSENARNGGDEWGGDAYPVYYRFAKSPFKFDNDRGIPLAVHGVQPGSSPYVVWSPAGGVNGTIIVSDDDHSDVFTNNHAGMPDMWQAHRTPQSRAYSRAMLVPKADPSHVMIFGPGYKGNQTTNPYAVSVLSVDKLLAAPFGDSPPWY
jgi:hypothetical protein